MAPVGETTAGDGAAGMGDEPSSAGAAAAGKKGSYVPPALRGDRAGAVGERMGGSKYGERDDLATLRVTNVSCLSGSDPIIRMRTFTLGFRDGRRAGTSGHVRAVRSCHQSVPCQG